MENKFKPGDVVCTVTNTSLKLVIKRSVSQIYFCGVHNDAKKREQVYFERELMATGIKVVM